MIKSDVSLISLIFLFQHYILFLIYTFCKKKENKKKKKCFSFLHHLCLTSTEQCRQYTCASQNKNKRNKVTFYNTCLNTGEFIEFIFAFIKHSQNKLCLKRKTFIFLALLLCCSLSVHEVMYNHSLRKLNLFN